MKRRERGAGLLVAVILVITVAAFAVIVAASQSGGDVRGSDLHADSVQALLLAETGLERALKRFATGTACAALGPENLNNLGSLQMAGGGAITIGAGLTTDFSNPPVNLPATQCRIPVTGTVTPSNVSRTIHAIVDRNLLGGVTGGAPFNADFNNPTTVGAPTSWTLTQPATPATQLGYANDGGHELQGGTCSRSAYLIKHLTNNYTVTAQGLANVNFTATGGSVTTVTFHYRLNQRGANGACLGGGANAGPADICAAAGGQPGTICFRTTDTLGTNSANVAFNTAHTNTQAVGCPDAGAISAFATCATGYQGGYPVKATINITTGGAGTRTITAFRYMMRLQQGGANARREMFLDHIEATNNTAVGAAHVRVWRDCSSAANPVNCV